MSNKGQVFHPQAPRKRKSERRQRTVLICVRFTPAELEQLSERANGKPLSTFLREQGLQSSTTIPKRQD